MITVRLEPGLERKLAALSRKLACSKSAIIKSSLKAYLEGMPEKGSPYSLGADLFGRQGSGKPGLSAGRKALLKRKIREKKPWLIRAP